MLPDENPRVHAEANELVKTLCLLAWAYADDKFSATR